MTARSRLWHKAPFVRLLLPFMAGIMVQEQGGLSLLKLVASCTACFCGLLVFFALPLRARYQFYYISGILIHLLMALAGSILVRLHDIRNDRSWFGHGYRAGSFVGVTLEQPLVETANSYKAIGSVNLLYDTDLVRRTRGRIILYFKKEAAAVKLEYGSRIVFRMPLQPVRSSGNPGGFHYKAWCLHQGITHQAYLSSKDLILQFPGKQDPPTALLFAWRNRLLGALKDHIPGKKESGLAEALLIGYRTDLDEELAQAYTRMGVVHIIAISGMHLALVYGLLLFITRSLGQIKKLAGMRALLVLAGLWAFSLLAGAQASVVRSAVMFTCLALAPWLGRKANLYNTLALSAFILLCYQPYWLWDAGFQLSFSAVLSILIFYRPLYRLACFQNKLLAGLWNTLVMTLAAQVLTTPISLYHFHQFPVLSPLTNLVAVPLSGLVLSGEIILVAFSWLPAIAEPAGFVTGSLIHWMNAYIERLDTVSFSVWKGISISLLQCLLLMALPLVVRHWLEERGKEALFATLGVLLAFVVLRSASFIQSSRYGFIVYNIPHHRAMDLVSGRSYGFLCDVPPGKDMAGMKEKLGPSRILYRLSQDRKIFPGLKSFVFYRSRFLILDTGINLQHTVSKTPIDFLILSGNLDIFMKDLCRAFSIRQVIIDSSVPLWKARIWEKACDSISQPCFVVGEKGAFVMKFPAPTFASSFSASGGYGRHRWPEGTQ